MSAINAIGESDQSVSLMLVAATVPDSPGQPTMLESDKTYIKIGWTINYDGGDELDDYEVDWKIETNDLFDTI